MSNLQLSADDFYLVTIATEKKYEGDEKWCYFNRYGCSLYENKAPFSVSQISVAMTKSYF